MLPDRYDFGEAEPRLARLWAESDVYAFDRAGSGPIFTIDTPPLTVSGAMHIGHCYSYSHADIMARFHRMRGARVFYPPAFDDNGLPTERFVEKTIQRKATQMERAPFIEECLRLIQQTEQSFEAIWRRLALSVDWRQLYTTISPQAQRVSQWSFIQLYQAGRAYAQPAPALWCPECQTAIAQAEVDDLTLPARFSTLAFTAQDGSVLPIATTRPELLPACVAIFVHPADARYAHLIGAGASIPCPALMQGRIEVPILADELADPARGSGAVMCCTFGDATDVRWWRTHQLPLRAAIGRDGRMTALAGAYAGLTVPEARKRILRDLADQGLILRQEMIEHSVGAHERCGTPVEYLHTRQWFIRILDQKERFLEAGRKIRWRPEYMRQRYEHWVENLQWDWCISRQRYLGVPFPAWTCHACGEIMLAELEQLPVDPRASGPGRPCPSCSATDFTPEPDIMDTWATSSCTPLIIARWCDDRATFAQRFPASLRPQGHDIIRTWAFYSIVKALYHTGQIPWQEALISGHALSPQRRKISKSKEHNEVGPMELMEDVSADALRYWASSGRPGSDMPFSAELLSAGRRLVTKLWSASRFAERHLQGYRPGVGEDLPQALLPTDRWLLSRLARTIAATTTALERSEYAAARAGIEQFFWSDLCDNYVELAKARLYHGAGPERDAARWTLYHALLSVLKMLAPFLPYVTEEIYQGLFKGTDGAASVHIATWPAEQPAWIDAQAEEVGDEVLELLRQVRRYKAERGLSVGAELETLHLRGRPEMNAALVDIKSATRARVIVWDGDQ